MHIVSTLVLEQKDEATFYHRLQFLFYFCKCYEIQVGKLSKYFSIFIINFSFIIP